MNIRPRRRLGVLTAIVGHCVEEGSLSGAIRMVSIEVDHHSIS